jgi:hypothetical protein
MSDSPEKIRPPRTPASTIFPVEEIRMMSAPLMLSVVFDKIRVPWIVIVMIVGPMRLSAGNGMVISMFSGMITLSVLPGTQEQSQLAAEPQFPSAIAVLVAATESQAQKMKSNPAGKIQNKKLFTNRLFLPMTPKYAPSLFQS